MTSPSFRFIHASDFRLELPVDGLSECPESLENAILEAPRVAVERLFATALKEKVDFVVLSGDLLSPRDTGPWGPLFLIEQFEKLASEKIAIFWATGKTDSPDVVPGAFRFPENVRIFPVGTVEEAFFTRDSVAIARLWGTSGGKAGVAPRGFEADEGADDLYTIGVFNGRLPDEALRSENVRYWALGGARIRETVSRSPSLAIYAGSTLARNFGESGDFGATLVEVAESGRTTATPFRTSPLRWTTETLVVKADETEEEILAEVRARTKAIQEKARENATFSGRAFDGETTLVAWRVEAEGAALQAIRYGNLSQTILRDLRTDFGKTAPIVYPIEFEAILPERFSDELYERQSILGDYLRTIRYYLENSDEKIDVAPFLSDELRDWSVRERAKRELEARRQRNDDSAETAELAARVAALESNVFRPEVSALYELLTFDSFESDATPERLAELASRRRSALLEASALGVDLLSETETTSVLAPSLKSAQKKNREIAAELRRLQKNIEGKESLS